MSNRSKKTKSQRQGSRSVERRSVAVPDLQAEIVRAGLQVSSPTVSTPQSKPKPPQNTRSARAYPPRAKLTQWISKPLTLFWSLLLAAVSIVGTAITMWPRVKIAPPTDLADAHQPYAVPFLIQNAGSLPVYDVEVKCAPQTMNATYLNTGKHPENYQPTLEFEKVVAAKVPSGETLPFVCDVMRFPGNPEMSVNYANLIVFVSYRVLPFMPRAYNENGQGFETIGEPGAKLRWREARPILQHRPLKPGEAF